MNEKIIQFINELLKARNISQQDFALTCNYSRPYISRLLGFAQPSNQENLTIMLEALGYNFNNLLVFHKTFAQKMIDLYRAMTFLDDNLAIQLYESIQEFADYIPFTESETEYKIIQYIYLYTYQRENADFEAFKRLGSKITTVAERYQGLYYDYLGVTYKNRNDFKQARAYTEKAMELDLPNDIAAMVYYHLGMIYERLGMLDLANKYNFDALRIFQFQNNITRLLAVQLHIANIHLKSNSLDMAESQYLDIIEKAEQINDELSIFLCLYNLSLLSIKRHKYTDALDYLTKIEKIEPLDEEGILQKCICLQRLGRYDEFNQLYKKSINLLTANSPQLSELVILKYHADEALNDDYINHLLAHIDTFSNSDDVDRTIRVYEHIIAYYEHHRKYKEANKFLKKKSELIGINPTL